MKFEVGDLVTCDSYEMDGCCHDCEGTAHYLEFPEFVIESIIISEGLAFHKDCSDGYKIEHLNLHPISRIPLYQALK